MRLRSAIARGGSPAALRCAKRYLDCGPPGENHKRTFPMYLGCFRQKKRDIRGNVYPSKSVSVLYKGGWEKVSCSNKRGFCLFQTYILMITSVYIFDNSFVLLFTKRSRIGQLMPSMPNSVPFQKSLFISYKTKKNRIYGAAYILNIRLLYLYKGGMGESFMIKQKGFCLFQLMIIYYQQ